MGPLYLGFLLIVLCAGFGLIAARSKQLACESSIDRLVSREGVFLGNNILLAALTATVLVGTVFPLLNEALTGAKVSVGAPYFDRTAAPVMLLLLFLMGIGPLLPWRVGSGRYLLQRLKWPVWAGALTVAGLVLTGVRHWAAVAAFGLAAFVGTATIVEMVRGVRAHRRATGGGVARSAFGAVARNRRLYGGLIAHLGLVIVIVAITWSSTYATQKEVTLGRGQSTTFAGYDLRYTGSTFRNDPNRVVFISTLQILKDGRPIGVLIPSLNFYPSSQDPIGTPSISKGTPFNGFHDLYASLQSLGKKGVSATFRLYSNPGVMWLWTGGAVIVLGGIVALWPVRRSGAPGRLRRPSRPRCASPNAWRRRRERARLRRRTRRARPSPTRRPRPSRTDSTPRRCRARADRRAPGRWRDRRWRVVVASLVPVVLLAALLGFGLGRDPRATQQGQLIGKPAPDFALQDLRTGQDGSALGLPRPSGRPELLGPLVRGLHRRAPEPRERVAAVRQRGNRVPVGALPGQRAEGGRLPSRTCRATGRTCGTRAGGPR